MWTRENQDHVFPSMVILTIGALCIWVSQAKAESLESLRMSSLKAENQIANTESQLIDQCDGLRSKRKLEFEALVQKTVDPACGGQSQCETKRPIVFNGKTLNVSVQGAQLPNKLYPTHFKSADGAMVSEQMIIESSLLSICAKVSTHQDLEAFYNSKSNGFENEDAKAVNQEIEAVKLALLGTSPSAGQASTAQITGKREKSKAVTEPVRVSSANGDSAADSSGRAY